MAKRVAVIDIGSNSIRIVVYEKTSRFAFHILYETKSRVRLSEGAYQDGNNLQEAPMQRALDSLSNFITIISSYKARKTLCIATSALRDAPNKKDFILKVKNSLGLKIKIIDGKRESYLGAIACANLLPQQNNALSVDIGGGSTEFSLINEKNIDNNISLNLGTVRIKELFFDNNDLDGAVKYIDSKLIELNSIKAVNLIGIGGTFRAISMALMKFNNYPFRKLHAYKSNYEEFDKFLTIILNSNEDDLKNLNIKKNRFDIIKPGALILQRIINKIKIKTLITSGVGVREGVYLADMLRNSKDKLPSNYNTSVRYILDSHIDNTAYSNQLCKIAKSLFDISHEKLHIDKKYRYELAIAAKLCTSGSNIHFYSQYKHSYHIIQDALEFGFTHQETTLIATLIKYAKRKLPSSSHIQKYKDLLPNIDNLNYLSSLLSISISLLSHQPKNIDFNIEFKDNIFEINSKNNLYLAKENLKKIDLTKNITIKFIY